VPSPRGQAAQRVGKPRRYARYVVQCVDQRVACADHQVPYVPGCSRP
jgi:hypothetical protein